MKLKPIPQNTVVHTPTEEEAKELLAILHENGYSWCRGSSLIKDSEWENYQEWTCYWISSYVEFDNIQECNEGKIKALTLAEFKERYCEEEKPQPKFKVGDKVIALFGSLKLNATIIGVDEYGDYSIEDSEGHKLFHYTDEDLAPYTEPETKPTEDMETKELNLCELLKGHEGETFYSPIVGDCTLKAITDYIYVAVNDHPSYCFFLDGRRENSGAVVFFPSRALYEQYPLDPYTAWMKWQEEQKKHWLSVTVWIDDLECESDTAIDTDKIYFRTPADRDKCIEEIKAIIEKYSK